MININTRIEEEKGKVFVFFTKNESVTESSIRLQIKKEEDLNVREILVRTDNMMVFSIPKKKKILATDQEVIKVTNLIKSYGASELPPAPEEITDPEPSVEQEKKTTTRRRRNTRRKTTKTTEASE